MNRNRKKAAAATLAAGMAVVLGAGTVMAAASTGDNGLQKEETVYVNTTAGGEVTDVTVSDWLKNSGDSSNSEVKDASDLQDIKNVKGDETFTQNGNDLTWSTDGKDIYYQGKTEKNLPVSVGIKYYMDGTEVSPEALAGKTGHLKMEVTYTNTSKTTKTVNGKKTDIYSPFVMVTGMILSTDNFSNITVDNGKVISDGSRNVVVGFGMPGMKESLDMSSDIADEVNIPEGFTVEADVTDCEMNSTFTVALTDIFKDIDLNDVDGLDELKDSMKDLTDVAGLDEQGCDYIPVPVTIDGRDNQWHNSGGAFNESSGLAITTSCEDVEGALQFVNDLLDQDIHNLRFWGVEGTDYEVDENGEFYRTEEERTKQSDTAYKASHTCPYSYFPQYTGTSDDGINANKPDGQASEFFDGLNQDVKETFEAYGVETYVEMLGTNEAPGDWYPMWSFSNNFTTDTPGGVAWNKIADVKHEQLPQVVMAKDFDAAWDTYMDAYNACHPEDFISELQTELDTRMEQAAKFK